MAEQRLIDSNADVYPYVETWTCNCSEYGVQKVMAVDDISTLPEIDPETIPIVRQLREELALITHQRDVYKSVFERITAHCDCNDCEKCAHYRVTWNGYTPDYECPLSDRCVNRDMWKWRGPRKEE